MDGIPPGQRDKSCGAVSVLGDSLKNNIAPLKIGTVSSLDLRTDFAMGGCGILG